MPSLHEAVGGMPSILFLARDLEIGGAQRQLIELAAGMHTRGWKVLVVTFYPGGALRSALGSAGVREICLDKKGRWDIVGFMLRLTRLLRHERVHVAYGALGVPNILLTLLKPVIGNTRVVWAIAASNMDLTRYDWFMRLEFHLGVLLARFADLMISNSRAGLRYHAAAGYPPGRITVIPNGVDMELFRPNIEARRRVRAEWGIADNERLIGLVGRVDPMKDHGNFLRAAAKVAAAHRDTRYVCVGDGPVAYRAGLEALAGELGLGDRLIWAGARNDISDVYSALDLKVSASLFGEGLPNTIVEAMACGVPCVVTDVGDCAEVVDGLGWICPPGDSAALSTAILSALESPCDATRIRQHICAHYSARALLDRTIAELSGLEEPC